MSTSSTTTTNQTPIQVGTTTPIPMDTPVVLPPPGPTVTSPITSVNDSTPLSNTAPVINQSGGSVVTPAVVPGNAVPVGTQNINSQPSHPGIIAPDTGAGIVSPISNVGKPGEVNNINQVPGEKVGFDKCIHTGPEGIHSADDHKYTPTVHAGQLNFDSHGEAYMPKHGANDDRDMSRVTGNDPKTLSHLNEQQRHQAQKNVDKELMGDSNQGVLDKASAALGVVGHTLAAKYHGTFVKDDKDDDTNNTNDAAMAADPKWVGVPQHQVFTPESNSLPMTTKPSANVVVDTPATTTAATTTTTTTTPQS